MAEEKKNFWERRKGYWREFKFFDSNFWWGMASTVVTGIIIIILAKTNPELLKVILDFFTKYD